MLKNIIDFFITANVSNEDYRIAKDDMYNNNVMMLRVLSSIATVIFIVCMIPADDYANDNQTLFLYVKDIDM